MQLFGSKRVIESIDMEHDEDMKRQVSYTMKCISVIEISFISVPSKLQTNIL